MRRFLFQLVLLGALAISRFDGFGFALAGPITAWQVAIGVGSTPPHAAYGGAHGPNLRDEEYRWNVPIITYGFDQPFVNYFGTNGIRAIEENFKILNDLPPISQISDQVLSNNYLFGASEFNTQAAALSIIDLKSFAMPYILKHVGLIEPELYVWSARSRAVYTRGDVSFTNYVVIRRNYDPITRNESAIINGVTYSYTVAGDFLSPVPFTTTTAATGASILGGQTFWGLTYDDVGGLREIYRTNNFNTERVVPNLILRSAAVFGGSGSGSVWDSPFSGLGNAVGGGIWDIPFTGSTGAVGGVIVGGVGATNVVTTNLFTGVDIALRGGLDKITYVRVNFDALLGQGFLSLTNTFGDQFWTNGVLRTQQVGRRIFRPDIVFRSADLGLDGDNQVPVIVNHLTAEPINNYDIVGFPTQSPLGPDTGPDGPTVYINGPGVTSPQNELLLSNFLPYYIHTTTGVTEGPPVGGGVFVGTFGTWGSFDGSTITTIYPNYMNLQISDLELLVQQSQQQQ